MTNRLVLCAMAAWAALGVFPGDVGAQPLERPREYKSYDPERVERYSESEIPPNQVWKVNAIRDGVPVWRTEAIDEKAGELGFLEEVTVLAVQPRGDQWVFQVGDCSARRTDVADARKFTVRGWVKGEDLLLVPLPLRSVDSRVPRKIVAMSPLGKGPSQFREEFVELSWNPLGDGVGQASMRPGLWLFVFANRVYRNEAWLLVASRPDLGPYRDAEDTRANCVIVGWVRKSLVFPWDTRQALQPYRLRRIPAPVFRTRRELADDSARGNALWTDPEFETTPDMRSVLHAWKQRFPILSLHDGNPAIPFPHAQVLYPLNVEDDSQGPQSTRPSKLIDYAVDRLMREGLSAADARAQVQWWISNPHLKFVVAWVPIAKPSRRATCEARERTAEGCVDLAMERVLLFTAEELNEYLHALEALGNDASQARFQDFWMRHCAQVFGEPAADMTVAKCLDYRFGTMRPSAPGVLDVSPDLVTSEQLARLSREARDKYLKLNALYRDALRKDSPNWAENLSGVRYTWISEFDLL